MLRAAVIVLLIALLPSPLQAEARIALLVGNQVYTPKVGPLRNPHEDVALVGTALKQLGFQVTILKDADYRAMDVAIKRFVTDVRSKGKGTISFFYYSGHGAANPDTQINYLIPVDVADPNDGNLWYQSFQQNDLIDKLSKQAPNATHYVVFDACRNELNLSGPAAKAIGAEKGFVPVAQTPGLLIAYATAQGKTAADVGDNGGPYARALVTEIVKPKIEAVTMFRNVQIRVKEDIGQDPWLSFPALPEVYLAGRGEEKPAATSVPPPQPAASEAERAWDRTKDTTSVALLEAFIARYKDTYYADIARARVEDLKKQQIAFATPPAPPTPAAPRPAARCDGVEITVGQNERRCFKPGAGKTEHFKDCPACPEMVVVPAGNFMMGSSANEPGRDGGYRDEAQLRVTISAPFAVGRYAVTFEEWDACVADGGCNGYKPADEGWGRGKYPVINVNWDDAKAYGSWLTRKTGKTYRLLSEAEREYATRAGTTTPFWFGSSTTPNQANYAGYKAGGSKGEYRHRTVPVDSFQPNPWGLYNVHGNVWEWMEDCWNSSNTGNPGDGGASTTGDCSKRVVRGGSWFNDPQFLRSADRGGNSTGSRGSYRGFRLARTLHP
jgi:formylglycine-generating enzyme required for sulfatase activity